MTVSSPRLDRRLAEAALRLDDPSQPVAETWRQVCAAADHLGLPLPGYDTIRLIVRRHRRRREELRRLLEPVLADALRGRFTEWDLDRMIEANLVARKQPR